MKFVQGDFETTIIQLGLQIKTYQVMWPLE